MFIADVGDNIYVSDYEYCNLAMEDRPPATIHIYRGVLRYDVCEACKKEHPIDRFDIDGYLKFLDKPELFLVLQEGRSLVRNDCNLNFITLISDFSRGYSHCRMLIHCAAGQTRSPTAALIAKMARGKPMIEAIGEITDAMIKASAGQKPPIFYKIPLMEIERWARQGNINA